MTKITITVEAETDELAINKADHAFMVFSGLVKSGAGNKKIWHCDKQGEYSVKVERRD